MLPAVCLAVGLLTSDVYQGIPLDTLAYIHNSCLLGTEREEEYKIRGAYSTKSLPLYMKLLTTEPDDQDLLPPKTWLKLQISACALVPKVDGDKSAFVQVGINLLSHPNEYYRTWALRMLLSIATADDVSKVKAVINPDDPKKLDTLLQAAKVLSVIGGKHEVKYLEALLASDLVQGDKFAHEHVAGSVTYLKRRLDEENALPAKK